MTDADYEDELAAIATHVCWHWLVETPEGEPVRQTCKECGRVVYPKPPDANLYVRHYRNRQALAELREMIG